MFVHLSVMQLSHMLVSQHGVARSYLVSVIDRARVVIGSCSIIELIIHVLVPWRAGKE